MIAGTELNEDGTMGVNDLPQLGPFSYGNHQICSGNQYSEDSVPGQPSPGGIIEDHFTYIDLPPPPCIDHFSCECFIVEGVCTG